MQVFFCRAAVLLLACLALCLWTGCEGGTPSARDRTFAYAEASFSASVSGTLTRLSQDGYTGDPALVGEGRTGVPQPVAATIRVTISPAPRGGTPTVTEMSVTYSEPPALAGVTITATALPIDTTETGRSATDETRPMTVILTRPMAAGEHLSVDLSHAAPTVTESLLAPVLMCLPVGDVVEVTPTRDNAFTVTREDSARGIRAAYTFSDTGGLPTTVTWRGKTAEYNMKIEKNATPPLTMYNLQCTMYNE